MNKGRLIGIVLVLSVSLNLLVIGAFIGRTLSRPHRGPMAEPLGWVLRNLDEDAREKIKPILENHARIVAPVRAEMNEARREFRRLLSEKDLDEIALGKSLDRLRMASGEFQSTMHGQMVLVLKDLPPEQRRKVARFLMRGHPDRAEHRRGLRD